MRKSQVSFEFVLIFAIVMFGFTTFLYFFQQEINNLTYRQDVKALRDLGDMIKREIVIAAQVQDNYFRNFEMPLKLNGKNYSVNVSSEGLDLAYDHYDIQYYTPLPFPVGGAFADRFTEDTTKHCITKNEDGIRVSMNLVSIEYAEIGPDIDSMVSIDKSDSSLFDANGRLKVQNGDFISVYVRINCVEDIRTVRTITKAGPLVDRVEKPTLIYRESTGSTVSGGGLSSIPTAPGPNPFFRKYFSYNLRGRGVLDGITTSSITDCPPGTPCPVFDLSENLFTDTLFTATCESGSGNIFKFIYEVTGAAPNDFEISFDENFYLPNDANVMVVDCGGKLTSEIVPSTKLGASFVIN